MRFAKTYGVVFTLMVVLAAGLPVHAYDLPSVNLGFTSFLDGGLPVSTTHAAVGAVMGIGFARGVEAVNFSIVYKIMLYWILTVPTAAVTSMVIFKFLQFIL